MSLEQFLRFLTQATIILIAIQSAVNYARNRSRTRLDIALIFLDLGLIVLFQWLAGVLQRPLPWLGTVNGMLLMAQPYLLLRVVGHLQPIRQELYWIGSGGLILSWLTLVVLPAPLPGPVVILLVLYFLSIEGSAVWVLFRGAGATRGVTHWRLNLAAVASLLLAGVLLISGILAILPDLDIFLNPVSQFAGLFSMILYYLGFAPPNWLRRSWQLGAFYEYIKTSRGDILNESTAETLKRLSVAAERAVGGRASGVFKKINDQEGFFLAASSLPMGSPELLSPDHLAVKKVWRDRSPLLFSQNDLRRKEKGGRTGISSAGSWMIVPISTPKKAWGVLFVHLMHEPLFASEDLIFLSLLCEQTAILLDYDNFLSEQKGLIDQLRRYNRRLETINTIDRAILAAASTQKIASQVLLRLSELVPSDRASIVLFDLEKRLGQLVAAQSPDGIGPQASLIFPMDDFPPFDAASPTREVTSISNILEEDPVSPIFERLRQEGIRSVLYTPLIVEGKLIGAIALSSMRVNAYQPENRGVLREVADQLAISLQQARLREELERANRELEERVADRTQELETTVKSLQEEVEARQQASQNLRIAQERLKQRAVELNQANKELEAFAYSVSHDLRAPLRAIDGFSRILTTRYAGELDEVARRYLELVRSNTQQMGQLIDDLLSFSRLNRHSMNVQTVEPAGIARVVLRDLLKLEDGRQVEIKLAEPISVCQADPGLLKQVYTNLLSNALKFSSTRSKACIEIGSFQQEDQTIYYVKDNGVGFDMKYAGKLFGVFQRLHRAEDFEGTGVGLAIVQRIIHRHGGKVWAEAEVDQGAAFYFTLPAKAQEKEL